VPVVGDPGAVDDGAETTELLRALIRNACVNTGTPDGGGEERNAATLAAYLDGIDRFADVEVHRFEPEPGRVSLVQRIMGADADAPSLCLMAHTDVVPADAARWTHDPFAGEVHDGVVWGRGAVDMLNQAAAQAVAVRHLLESGWRPSGDLVLFFPADEEAGGGLGARWITDHAPDVVACDYLVSEGGGFHLPDMSGRTELTGTDSGLPAIGVMVGEKGPYWQRFSASGTPGHASVPWRSDNAVLTAADAVVRIGGARPAAQCDDVWVDLIDAMAVPEPLRSRLLSPDTLDEALEELATDFPAETPILHACTHLTFAANTFTGGAKTNVIASSAQFTVDCRLLPGRTDADADAVIDEAFGPLAGRLRREVLQYDTATASPVDTPLWHATAGAVADVIGPSRIAPWVAPFATDARFLRPRGTVAYGVTLHDEHVDLAAWLRLFHGDDERVSVRALGNATAFYGRLCQRLWGT
jgi:acetylornithine deacetylase/succinyl-diaminopimelate desuccinylase-like protein